MKIIWRATKFGMNLTQKNMDHYHDHCLEKDVLVLADVFEKFIDTCLKFYKLVACHYFSSSGLSWDAMLKMTDVELEKITAIDKYLFTEKGLRGEISYIAKRCSEVNNKYEIMILQNHQNTHRNLIGIICMVRELVDIFHMVGLIG